LQWRLGQEDQQQGVFRQVLPFFIADEFSDQLNHGFVPPFVWVGSAVSDSLSRPVKDEGEPIPQPSSPSPSKPRRRIQRRDAHDVPGQRHHIVNTPAQAVAP